MNYSLATLWHERPRFLPGIGAVAFSAVLIALQCGLLLGLFKITSIPVDNSSADVWVGSPEVLSVDLGRPIPLTFLSRVAGDPRVERRRDLLPGVRVVDQAGRRVGAVHRHRLRPVPTDNIGSRQGADAGDARRPDRAELDRHRRVGAEDGSASSRSRRLRGDQQGPGPHRRRDRGPEEPGRALRVLLPRRPPGSYSGT